MTLPHERTRAVIKCEEFLRQLVLDSELPQDIRSHANHLLRHYPSAAQVYSLGRLEEFLTNDELDTEHLRRITAHHQRLFSSALNPSSAARHDVER